VNQDIQVVDDYLASWDLFAQGGNELVPELRDAQPEFEAALTRLLNARDRRAPARMVFYPVVQVGGAIPVDSTLGQACSALLGPDFPVTTTENGQRVYFGGDLYLWWEANRRHYEPFPRFDDWTQRDFAQTVVIPMYRSAANSQ
jgi:hypothetical protein